MLLFSFSSAQIPPEIELQNTIGGSEDDMLYSIQPTNDGGFIIGGYSYSGSSGDKTENNKGENDYWIVKTDASLNIQWQNTIEEVVSILYPPFSKPLMEDISSVVLLIQIFQAIRLKTIWVIRGNHSTTGS